MLQQKSITDNPVSQVGLRCILDKSLPVDSVVSFVIQWIVISPVDSVIYPLNNRGLADSACHSLTYFLIFQCKM